MKPFEDQWCLMIEVNLYRVRKSLTFQDTGDMKDNAAGSIQSVATSAEDIFKFLSEVQVEETPEEPKDDEGEEDNAKDEGEAEEEERQDEGEAKPKVKKMKTSVTIKFADHSLKIVKSDKLTLALTL